MCARARQSRTFISCHRARAVCVVNVTHINAMQALQYTEQCSDGCEGDRWSDMDVSSIDTLHFSVVIAIISM